MATRHTSARGLDINIALCVHTTNKTPPRRLRPPCQVLSENIATQSHRLRTPRQVLPENIATPRVDSVRYVESFRPNTATPPRRLHPLRRLLLAKRLAALDTRGLCREASAFDTFVLPFAAAVPDTRGLALRRG